MVQVYKKVLTAKFLRESGFFLFLNSRNNKIVKKDFSREIDIRDILE